MLQKEDAGKRVHSLYTHETEKERKGLETRISLTIQMPNKAILCL